LREEEERLEGCDGWEKGWKEVRRKRWMEIFSKKDGKDQ
jgi:hypothetical protein